MGTAQILWIILVTISGTINLAFHGKPRGNYSFLGWIVSASMHIGLLYWGGFFG